MISSVLKYAYPNAKVRAMKGLLLSADVFRSLLRADTFEEYLHVLQTSPYAEALSAPGEADVNVPILTNIFYKQLFLDYKKTIQSLQGKTQAFFILLYQQYELVNLKTILRGICSKIEPQLVASLLLPTSAYPLFSKETLLAFRDVHEVVNHLQGSFFQHPLNLALRRFEEEQEFFPLEMALDLHYYHALWDNMSKLPDQEQHIIKNILGMWLDILNIAWIVRFKEQYHFSPEEILNYTIHHGHVFTLRDRQRLANAANPSDVVEYLKDSAYGKLLPDEISLPTLHVALNRHFVLQLQKYFTGNPFQIGAILGYLLLKEFEISDLLTLAEAKKYGFSLEQSQQFMIHTT